MPVVLVLNTPARPPSSLGATGSLLSCPRRASAHRDTILPTPKRRVDKVDMEVTQLERLAVLRAVVGYLGEQGQYAWWQSSFFSPASRAFLAPVFGRTQVLAQISGVTRAASIVHDERIGIGQVYHLFRLPEDIEQGIHRVLHSANLCEQVAALVSDKEAAMAYLRQEAGTLAGGDVGPVHIGNTRGLRDASSWSVAAAHYVRAFEDHLETYPYFTDVK